jgi:SAM-dependent methyltransferase
MVYSGMALNRAWWDERTPIHVRADFYDVAGFKAGRCSLGPQEVVDLGSVAGKRLVHLQCHFGLDTLSWARRGAIVTGLDFSAPAIEAARALAAETGLDARFVLGNVLDAHALLRAEPGFGAGYDIVYTGIGALCWLPDLDRWAEQVAGLLRPGGALYLIEIHPLIWIFNPDGLTVAADYFTAPEGHVDRGSGTYADLTAETRHNETRVWNHNIGEVATALLKVGLVLTGLVEADRCYFPAFPMMVPDGTGGWRMPPGTPSLPMTYTLRAVKPI